MMNKIVNYIRQGKGQGLIFLLAAAVLVTIFAVTFVKYQYNDFRPQLISAMDEMLPFTVQNGQIVEPKDSYKKIDLKLSGEDTSNVSIALVLDTRDDASDITPNAYGLYFMKDKFYIVSPNKVERRSLSDGVWDKQKAEELLDYFVGVLWLTISVVMLAVLFLLFLIKTLIVVLFGKIAFKIFQKKGPLEFSSFMRLGAIIVAVIETISLMFGMIVPINGLQRLLVEIVVAVVFVNKGKIFE